MGISHELSEEDVKFRYINEAITSKGWTKDSIFMEQQVKFTDGKISLHGNIVHREKPKFADYVLYVNKATPIAIIEAKDAKHTVSYGLQQAMEYAKMLDVKFAFSSNGEGFAEHDFLTGQERCFGMDEFPTREELIERYKKEINENYDCVLYPMANVLQGNPQYLQNVIRLIKGITIPVFVLGIGITLDEGVTIQELFQYIQQPVQEFLDIVGKSGGAIGCRGYMTKELLDKAGAGELVTATGCPSLYQNGILHISEDRVPEESFRVALNGRVKVRYPSPDKRFL